MPKRAHTSAHLDVDAAPVEPIFTVIALDHERVVVLAPADAVRFECLGQSGHKFTVCEVNFDLLCLLFQVFQDLVAVNTYAFRLRLVTPMYTRDGQNNATYGNPVSLSAVDG
jgi:hypothetical protein